MIDIHCHILPGIDDGAKTIDDSVLWQKRLSLKESIQSLPPLIIKIINIIMKKTSILEKVSDLNKHLESEGIPLTILPGQEIPYLRRNH